MRDVTGRRGQEPKIRRNGAKAQSKRQEANGGKKPLMEWTTHFHSVKRTGIG
jgi:hypothetical protein